MEKYTVKARKNRSPYFCLQKRDFPLFRADLCTKNKKRLPLFSEYFALNRGFPLNRCPLNRAYTISMLALLQDLSEEDEFACRFRRETQINCGMSANPQT